MKKIFCKECRYFIWTVHVCKFNKIIVEDYHEKTYTYKECSIINKNNNCPDFKKGNWIQRIKSMITQTLKKIFGYNE